MRDAFGGAFMIRVLIVFIIVYVGFTAIALNYARAFKAKNKIIEYIEEHELTDIGNMSFEEKEKMGNYFQDEVVTNTDYSVSINRGSCPRDAVYCDAEHGIVIYEKNPEDGNKEGTYYVVQTFFGWNIPFLNTLLKLGTEGDNPMSGHWIISGETRTIVNKS